MNEIEKLKTEHARYKAALEALSTGAPMTFRARAAIANNALKPTQPPVTLDLLITALKRYSLEHPSAHITFFDDESGNVDSHCGRLFSFSSLQEVYNFLTNEN